MVSLLRDTLFGIRTLRKNPAFALTAILTIGLGLGASAAIFSVVNAVLLRPLPYRDADRLVHIWPDLRNRNVREFPSHPGDVWDLRHGTTAFEGISAVQTGRLPVSGAEGDPEQVAFASVTPEFFRLMRAEIVRGRDFSDQDGERQPPPPPGAAPDTVTPVPPKIILTHEYWQRRFGGREDIVGSLINIGNGRGEIVGVLAPGFELLYPPDVNVERTPALFICSRLDWFGGNRSNVSQRSLARLKPGFTIDQAQTQVDAVAADLRKRFAPKESAGLHFRLERMYDDLVADVRPAILVLMGAVTFVLLIACANVANLLLVRAAARERELAVRAALGGSRGRLVRQLLAESLVISGAGVVVGLLLAQFGVDALIALGPKTLPRLDSVRIDPMVLAFAAVSGMGAAIVFGILPALRASRPDLMDVLRAGGRSAGSMSGRFVRNTVVVAEVALSLVLLIGSGLMVRSFVALSRIDPGYNPGGVLTFQIQNVRAQGAEGRAAFMRMIQERLMGIAGVQAVTAATPLPLDGSTSSGRWGTEEALTNPAAFHQGTLHFVLPGYFEAIGGRLLEGRTFTEEDNREKVQRIIVDDRLRAMAFPNQSAVGKKIMTRVNTDEPLWYEIIGVVAHQRHQSLAGETREAIFFTDGYLGHGAARRWAVRTAGDPAALAPVVRDEIRKLNPQLVVSEVQPMLVYVDQATAPTKFALFLVGVFAATAIVLAAIGLYGVLSTTVRQRTAEIGVRLAFGAHTTSIFRMVLIQGLRLSVIGLLVGLAVAVPTTRLMRSMLVGVTPTDVPTFVAIAALFLIVAALACWLPARRAAQLNLITALRDE